MWLRLRQITMLCEDTRRTALDLAMVLGLEACCTDAPVAPYGLKDTVFPIGHQFIDVVTPTRGDTAGARYLPRRGGDTGYVVTTQTDDVAALRARAAALGLRVFDRPDEGMVGFQLHPADIGGAMREVDEMIAGGDAPDGPWAPAGRYWQPSIRTELVSALLAAELQATEPAALAARWGAIAELPVDADAAGNPVIALDHGALRFVEARDGRGEGLGGIDVRVEDRAGVLAGARARGCTVGDDLVLIGGLRVRLVA